MTTTTTLQDDASVREKFLAHLKKNGPTRAKPMFLSTRTNYERGARVLKAMQADGEIEQVPDGYHRGEPVMAFCVMGDTRAPTNVAARRSFGGEATLAAMREWAYKSLMAHV